MARDAALFGWRRYFTELDRQSTFAEYEMRWERLQERIRDLEDPVGRDFIDWWKVFRDSVFDGSVAEPGLSETCGALLKHLVQLADAGDCSNIEKWYWRLKHLNAVLQRSRIPSLLPVAQLRLLAFNMHCVKRNRVAMEVSGDWSLDDLQADWDRGARQTSGFVYDNIQAGDRILIIGHSKVVATAVRWVLGQDRETPNPHPRTNLKLYVYCPGPRQPDGRKEEDCPAQPCKDELGTEQYKVVDRMNAEQLVSTGGVNKVLCATCAYSCVVDTPGTTYYMWTTK
jgi:hypothetical protein